VERGREGEGEEGGGREEGERGRERTRGRNVDLCLITTRQKMV
jgi:hypothetical protein